MVASTGRARLVLTSSAVPVCRVRLVPAPVLRRRPPRHCRHLPGVSQDLGPIHLSHSVRVRRRRRPARLLAPGGGHHRRPTPPDARPRQPAAHRGLRCAAAARRWRLDDPAARSVDHALHAPTTHGPPATSRPRCHRPSSPPAPAATSSWCCSCWPSASSCSPTSRRPVRLRRVPAGPGHPRRRAARHLARLPPAAAVEGRVRRPAAAPDRHPAQRVGAGDDPPPRPRRGARHGEGLALRQLTWSALAVAIAAVVLWFLRDHRMLRRYTFTAAVAGFGLLILPLVPGIGRTVNGSRIWIGLGPFTFQPGEVAKIVLAIFFAGYLVQNRDALSLAGRKVLGFTLPRGRDLGPIIVAWVSAWSCWSSRTTSGRPCCSSGCSSRCSTSPPSGLLDRHRPGVLLRRRLPRLPARSGTSSSACTCGSTPSRPASPTRSPRG